ncbi:hypothetical protein DM02DRAFT_653231 [Periconia macrospinosa]|uniref:Uncharacterized protein n=1 Tax=Periconia macrospinosa TaxID=97972 RepID=A0A2V1DWL6_9PLEO|nr:hypothetical protein DM02DRAFT_653231 [Periconia macrospinosa]
MAKPLVQSQPVHARRLFALLKPGPSLFLSSSSPPFDVSRDKSTAQSNPPLPLLPPLLPPPSPLQFTGPSCTSSLGHTSPEPSSSAVQFPSNLNRSPTLRRPNLETTKLAGTHIHKFSFVRPLLGPKAWVYGGDYKKPP